MEDISDIRGKLVSEGIRMLSEEGVDKLSLRRIAQICGVSCAAPYKHFRDKDDFLLAVADAAHDEWFARQIKAIAAIGADTSMQLRVICKEYLRFLCDNPNFCSLIIQKDDTVGKWQLSRLFDRSSITKNLIVRFAQEHGLTDEDVYSRIYVLRSLLYGAAIMNQNISTPMNEHTLQLLGRVIDDQI